MRASSTKHRIALVCALLLASVALACGPKVAENIVTETKKPDVVDPVMSKTADEWFVEGVGLLQESPPDYEAASKRFANALTRDETHFDARWNAVLTLEKQGLNEQAIEHCVALVAAQPENSGVYVAYGNALLGAGRTAEAIDQFRNALSRDIGNKDALNAIAIAYFRSGDFEQAIRMAKEVITLEGSNVTALTTLGMIYRLQKKPALAQYVLGRALEAAPMDPRVLNNLGMLAYELSKIPAAVARFEEAIEAAPDFLEARLNLGAIYLDYLDYTAALEQFEVAYGLAPGHEAAHLGYAASLYGAGEFEKSAQLYEAFAEAHPDADQPATRLSRLYERQLENPEKACVWYKRLVEFKPEDRELAVTRDFICKNAAK